MGRMFWGHVRKLESVIGYLGVEHVLAAFGRGLVPTLAKEL